MGWTLIIMTLVLILPTLFVWQYLRLSRTYYFDQSLYALRHLKHETVLYLSEQIMNNGYDNHEIIELRKMAAVLDLSINKFERLRKTLFNKTFRRIFSGINSSVKKAQKEVQMQSERILALKNKFSRA